MDRTQAIIARLASDHDGEILAAVAALRRLAAAKKLRIEEFITTKSDQQSSSYSAKPDYGKTVYGKDDEYLDDWRAVRRRVYEALETGLCQQELTRWEISFVASIRLSYDLSGKQKAALKRIAIKLGVPI